MRMRVLAAAGASAALAVGLLSGTATAQQSLGEQIRGLEVAAEQPSGYDRDALNINYDRDAVLSANQSTFGDCDGHFSRYDATCHDSADAVQIDHLVSVKEAWDSGLRGDDAWERIDGDESNLAVMTAGLNRSKDASDIAEWTPPHGPSVCHFTETYVDVKDQYGLSVDEEEKAVLLDLAGDCEGDNGNGGNGGDGENDAGDGGDEKDTGENSEEAPEPTPVEGDLEVTG